MTGIFIVDDLLFTSIHVAPRAPQSSDPRCKVEFPWVISNPGAQGAGLRLLVASRRENTSYRFSKFGLAPPRR